MHPKDADSLAILDLVLKSSWLEPGGSFLCSFLDELVEKTPCRASISGTETLFPVWAGSGRLRALTIESLWMGWCG